MLTGPKLSLSLEPHGLVNVMYAKLMQEGVLGDLVSLGPLSFQTSGDDALAEPFHFS